MGTTWVEQDGRKRTGPFLKFSRESAGVGVVVLLWTCVCSQGVLVWTWRRVKQTFNLVT